MSERFYSNQNALCAIENIKKSSRICHAYLITGDEGLGKKTFARLFAKTLLCTRSESAACDGCPNCKKVDSFAHPDVVLIRSKGGKNSIHIDAVREIKSGAYILPNEGRYKIYIIENAQNMSVPATNAFLKVLEEPPAHTLFILTAVSADELLETVVSRCVEIKLCPVQQADVYRALGQSSGNPEADAAVKKSGGNIGLAKKLLSDEDYKKAESEAESIARAIADKSEYHMLAAFSAVSSKRGEIKTTLGIACEILREALCVKMSGEAAGYETAGRLAGIYTTEQLIKTSRALLEAADGIDKNANTALLLSSTVAKIKAEA